MKAKPDAPSMGVQSEFYVASGTQIFPGDLSAIDGSGGEAYGSRESFP